MTKTLPEVIAEIEATIGGLRLEVEHWRLHVGSESHFMLCEIERLIEMLKELRKSIQ